MDESLREYADACARLDSALDLQRESVRFFRARGLKMLGYHHIPPPGARDADRADLIFAFGFPKKMVREYIDQRYFEIDPLPRIAQARTKPFRWGELSGSTEISQREQDFMDIVAKLGLQNGLAVPVFGPHGQNGYCGLSYGPGADVCSDVEVTILQEACMLFHLKYCELHPLPRPSADLSVREKVTLRLVAKGLSNAQIAAEMHISASTVDTNLRRIFKKLGVRDRVSAALRGIMVGVYD